MRSKSLNIGIGILAMVSVVSIVMSIWVFNKLKRIGYADTVKLVNEYKLKIDMEKEEGGKLNSIRSHADSLNAIYKLLSIDPEADQMQVKELETQLMRLSSLFDQEYARSNTDINEKVWKRLNADIDEYAKQNNMELLMGANGMGAVLYGSKSGDHTEQLIQFVNAKYMNGN